jgi:hypothetical protein
MAGADDAGWADADTKGAQRPQKGHKKRRTSRFALFAIVKMSRPEIGLQKKK